MVEGWETVYEGFAAVSTLSTRAYIEAAAAGLEDTCELQCRWHPSLAETKGKTARVLINGREMNVKAIINEHERNERAVIKVVGQG